MYKISNEHRQLILKYLSTRPYAEVFQLVALVVGLKPIENSLIMFNPSYPHRESPISAGKRRAIIVNAWPKKTYTFEK